MKGRQKKDKIRKSDHFEELNFTFFYDNLRYVSNRDFNILLSRYYYMHYTYMIQF